MRNILSTFLCPQNEDVQAFIQEKAIIFSQQNLSKTTLVYWRSEDETEKELVGYFTVALKHIQVHKKSVSHSTAKRLHNFSITKDLNEDDKLYILPAPLIGQLGKNFTGGNNLLISGSELLQMALNKIRKIQREIGGRFVYLECEDDPKLKKFYEENGFTCFGQRSLDGDETGLRGRYLLQYLRYLR